MHTVLVRNPTHSSHSPHSPRTTALTPCPRACRAIARPGCGRRWPSTRRSCSGWGRGPSSPQSKSTCTPRPDHDHAPLCVCAAHHAPPAAPMTRVPPARAVAEPSHTPEAPHHPCSHRRLHRVCSRPRVLRTCARYKGEDRASAEVNHWVQVPNGPETYTAYVGLHCTAAQHRAPRPVG